MGDHLAAIKAAGWGAAAILGWREAVKMRD